MAGLEQKCGQHQKQEGLALSQMVCTLPRASNTTRCNQQQGLLPSSWFIKSHATAGGEPCSARARTGPITPARQPSVPYYSSFMSRHRHDPIMARFVQAS